MKGSWAAWPVVNDKAFWKRYDNLPTKYRALAQEGRVATRRPKPNEEDLLAKIRGLPPDRVAEVEDFVDFLSQREQERHLSRATTKLSETAFAKVWDNGDDAEYDRL